MLRRHHVLDSVGVRHPCEVVGISDMMSAGVLAIHVTLDDPAIVAKRSISSDALQEVVQLELFDDGKIGAHDDPDAYFPSSKDSEQAAEAVRSWAKRGKHPKLSHLVLWLLDRMVIAQQLLAPGGRHTFKLLFRHELTYDMDPISGSDFLGTTGMFTGQTQNTAGKSRAAGKPNVNKLRKEDNDTYRVKTDLASTNALFDYAEKSRTKQMHDSVIEQQILEDTCEAMKANILTHKAKKKWLKDYRLENQAKQQAMKEMSASTRKERYLLQFVALKNYFECT